MLLRVADCNLSQTGETVGKMRSEIELKPESRARVYIAVLV